MAWHRGLARRRSSAGCSCEETETKVTTHTHTHRYARAVLQAYAGAKLARGRPRVKVNAKLLSLERQVSRRTLLGNLEVRPGANDTPSSLANPRRHVPPTRNSTQPTRPTLPPSA